MAALKVILTVLFVLVSIAIIVLVLMQEGDDSGLSGAIAGGSGSTYWSKNKGRSKEGMMNKITAILGGVFIVLSILLNLSIFQ